MKDLTSEAQAASPEDALSGPSGTMSSPRLARFEDEVGKLKVTGGGANPERMGVMWGIALTIIGFVIAILAWSSAQSATKFETIHRSQIMAVIGVGVAVVGIVIWLRNSLTRYMRYWLIRLVYEQREQTDAIVQSLKEKP